MQKLDERYKTSVFSFKSGKHDGKTTFMTFYEGKSKDHFYVQVDSVVNGVMMPTINASAFLIASENNPSTKWLKLSSPLLKLDDNNNPKPYKKRDEKGNLIDKHGNVVELDILADNFYISCKDKHDAVIYETMATIFLSNTNFVKDKKVPSYSTYAVCNLISFNGMRNINAIRSSVEDKSARTDLMNKERKSETTVISMDIKSGASYLSDLGFQINEKGVIVENTP